MFCLLALIAIERACLLFCSGDKVCKSESKIIKVKVASGADARAAFSFDPLTASPSRTCYKISNPELSHVTVERFRFPNTEPRLIRKRTFGARFLKFNP